MNAFWVLFKFQLKSFGTQNTPKPLPKTQPKGIHITDNINELPLN